MATLYHGGLTKKNTLNFFFFFINCSKAKIKSKDGKLKLEKLEMKWNVALATKFLKLKYKKPIQNIDK